MGLDTKTNCLTDRQSQCDFEFEKGRLESELVKIQSRVPRDADPRMTALEGQQHL
jgi:hypothetical protein